MTLVHGRRAATVSPDSGTPGARAEPLAGSTQHLRPLILVTNDDGITSPGLAAAVGALADLGELLIVAPATQQTGMGRSTPLPTETRVAQVTVQSGPDSYTGYAVPGSPAQAVMFGLLVLASRRPDLAVVGINYGENLGSCISGSGTVGAALEAATAGVPALAISLETPRHYHYRHGDDVAWDVAAGVTRRFAEIALGAPWPFDVDVLKIDIPAAATSDTPWRVTRQSRQMYWENVRVDALDEPHLGHLDYRVSIAWDRLEPDSDIRAFAGAGVISVVPLSIDMTSRIDLAKLDEQLRGPAGRAAAEEDPNQ